MPLEYKKYKQKTTSKNFIEAVLSIYEKIWKSLALRWELTSRCHEVAVVNTTYYEKPTLRLGASIGHEK